MTKDLCVPSLTGVLDEYKFSPGFQSLVKMRKMEDRMLNVFQSLYQEKKILSIEKCKPVKNEEGFMPLLKIFSFLDKNKYFKLFFIFSNEDKGNKFLGISLNDNHSIIVPPAVSEKYLKDLFQFELDNIEIGCSTEKYFVDKFLPVFKVNTANCTGFKDVTGNPEYDKRGIDVVLNFKLGEIFLQLKVARKDATLEDLKYVAEKQFNRHSDKGSHPEKTGVIFLPEKKENYNRTKKRVLDVVRKIWSDEYPFVSYAGLKLKKLKEKNKVFN